MVGLEIILKIIIYGIPAILAITLHEAAHGFAALQKGDDTAKRAGRLTLNPLKHIDPFGTILLPAMLIFLKAPFLFGYAKPVPVDFQRLRNPRRDMVYVAIAGPATNLFLAFLSALLIHGVPYLQPDVRLIFNEMLLFSMNINVLLALFNMIPLPPLDGGRVAVGLLPDALAYPLARLERYGFLILISALILLPALLNIIGVHVSLFQILLEKPYLAVMKLVASLAGLR